MSREPESEAGADWQPRDRVIAFADILLFRYLVSTRKAGEAWRSLLWALRDAMSERRADNNLFEKKLAEDTFLQARMNSFSDCTVISAPAEEDAELLVAGKMTSLAISLMKGGFFCRGGIAVGAAYHRGGVVLGPGMLQAHELESQSANYPRIVMEDPVADALRSQCLELNSLATIKRDFDGLWYLDILGTMAARKDAGDNLLQVRAHLVDMLKLAKAKYHYISKWRWCAEKFNCALNEGGIGDSVEKILLD